MSTFAEIENAMPQLNAEELMRGEPALHRLQRERSQGILFDDARSLWTEDDQTSIAVVAWGVMERAR